MEKKKKNEQEIQIIHKKRNADVPKMYKKMFHPIHNIMYVEIPFVAIRFVKMKTKVRQQGLLSRL